MSSEDVRLFEWIPFRREVGAIVELPEHEATVLITALLRRGDDSIANLYVDVAEAAVQDGVCGFHRDGQWISNVTAWAELPQPYRGGK